MELNFKHQALAINKTVFEAFGELPVDMEIVLPDYCPDIAHMLKCSVTPQLDSKHVNGEKLEVCGTLASAVHYCDERGILKTYGVSDEFSKLFEWKDPVENACIFVKANVDYVNFRAVSPRKIEIHGSVTIAVKACQRQEFPLLSGAEEENIEMKKETRPAVDYINSCEKFFLMDEVIEIGASRPPIQSILMHDAGIVLEDYKIINNKLILKGEVTVSFVYSSDMESPELETAETTIPLSQILELDQVDDECVCDVELSLEGMDLKPRSDVSGEMKNVAAEIRIKATASAYRTCEIPMVEEAYSTECESIVTTEPLEYMNLLESRKETFTVKKSIEIPDVTIRNVMRVCCRTLSRSVRRQGNEVIFSGAFAATILACDDAGTPMLVEKPIDFEYSIKVGDEQGEIICAPVIVPVACSYLLSGSNQVEVKIEVILTANIFVRHTEQIVSDIRLCEEKAYGANDRMGLVIYFANEGETVWEIAKKHHTTCERIRNENDLSEEILPEDRMLLIPCA